VTEIEKMQFTIEVTLDINDLAAGYGRFWTSVGEIFLLEDRLAD